MSGLQRVEHGEMRRVQYVGVYVCIHTALCDEVLRCVML
jgi:hypothetical protein